VLFAVQILRKCPNTSARLFKKKNKKLIQVAGLVKILVAYESKYGNTKLVAEKIMEGMKKVKGVEPVLGEIKQGDLSKVLEYDAILIGSPNHIGGPTRGAKKFVDDLGRLSLKGKSLAAFDTYLGRDFKKAVKKLEKTIVEKIPGSKLLTPSLSVRAGGMRGPVSDEDLSKAVDFGKRVATQVKT